MILIVRKSSAAFLISILLMSALVYQKYTVKVQPAFALPVAAKVVVIDAGHGGYDPGKVGSADRKVEKDINLEIALRLQALLEESGAVVIMTRIVDEDLAHEGNGGGNKKNRDLRARRILTNESKADILVSIHQNSFPSSSAKGAQVFFHSQSNEAKLLAKSIQDRLVQYVDPKNHRQAKDNSSYAMLKNTTIPAVIVECGFLTNYEEEIKLNNKTYQQQLAEGIYSGVKLYFEELKQVQKGKKTFQSLLPQEYFSPSDTH